MTAALFISKLIDHNPGFANARVMTSGERSLLDGYITQLYTSATAAAYLDSLVFSSTVDVVWFTTREGGSGYPVLAVGYNWTLLADFLYINDKGRLVREEPVISVYHELYHLKPASDTTGAGDSDYNAPSYDYQGDVLRAQNIVAGELALINNKQIAYEAAFSDGGTNNTVAGAAADAALEVNVDYSLGKRIDTARFGTNIGRRRSTRAPVMMC